jgi:hypothetical protein
MPADNYSSLSHLHMEYKQAQEDESWESFLGRARMRAVAETSTFENDVDPAVPFQKHGMGGIGPGADDTFYRVPVKVKPFFSLCYPIA